MNKKWQGFSDSNTKDAVTNVTKRGSSGIISKEEQDSKF